MERILDSETFGRSPQARRFLHFVTEHSFNKEKEGEALKAYTIGVQALGVLSERSCPETTARMQASRVRRLLAKFYQTEGRIERVLLQLPSGSYEPKFVFRPNQETTSADLPRVWVSEFENLSEAQSDGPFCRGLTDAIVRLLVHCPHFKVVRQRPSGQSPGGYVLRGSLTRMGDQVRLSAQLLGHDEGETFWSEHFDYEVNESKFIQIQDHLAERIACRVGDPALGVVVRLMRSADICDELIGATDRFYSFLKGPSSQRLVDARVALEECLPQAGGAALAHAAYACVLAIGTLFQQNTSKNQILSAEAHARLAVSKDSTCALGHLAKALIHYQHREAACVRRELLRAQELAMADGIVRALVGFMLSLIGDHEEGLAQLDVAGLLITDLPSYLLSAACLYQFHTRGDAKKALEIAEQIDVEALPWGDILVAACLSRLGRTVEARRVSGRITSQHGALVKKLNRHLQDALFVPEVAEALKGALNDAGLGSPSKAHADRTIYRVSANKRALPSEVRIGILQSLSGTMALSETHLVNAAMLAIDEINQAGGVLGRPVRAVVEDGASDASTFSAKAERLLDEHQTTSIFGCWTSSSRKAVLPLVEQRGALLWYPLQYEGLETSRNVVYTGSCLNQQIEPAVRWAQRQRKNSCYLVGSDYVFPRTAHRLIRALVEAAGGRVLGSAYEPLGAARFEQIAAEIAVLKPDIVYNTVNGSDNVALFEALNRAGIDAKRIPVMSFSLSELELARCAETARGHLACWSYFQSMDTPKNRELLARFRGRYGQAEVLSDPAVTAYSQVHLWKDVVQRAGSLETEDILAHLAGSKLQLGDDELEVKSNHHVQRRAVIGQVEGQQFRVLWSSPRPIEPQPWLGVDTTDSISRDLILGALKALPEMAAMSSLSAGHR